MSVNTDICDLRDGFSAEHRRLEELGGSLIAALEVGDRRLAHLLMSEFALALVQHMNEEERDSFQGLVDGRSRDARLIIEEHRHIRHRLALLQREAERASLRLSAASAFVDELRAHAAHEDAIFCRWANRSHDGGAAPPSRLDRVDETSRPPRQDR